MSLLEPAQKWELKAVFYLSLLHQAALELPAVNPGFARQAAMLNSRVRLVVRHRQTSRAWGFGPDGVTALGVDDPVDLTLTFESFRLFVKIVEEKTSPIRAILAGSLSVQGPLGLAYQFARVLSSLGGVLRLLREPPRDEDREEMPVAFLALFFALFQVFSRFIAMKGLVVPPVPWQLGFARENRTVSVGLGPEGVWARSEEGLFPTRQGAAWRLPDTLSLKLALNHPLRLVGMVITGRLRIWGMGASWGWVKAFVPFVKVVAPMLQGDEKKEEEKQAAPPPPGGSGA